MHDSPYPRNFWRKYVITRLASNIYLKYKQAFLHIIVVVGRTAPQFTIPQRFVRFVRSPGSQSLQARLLSFSQCWSGWTCCALAICNLLGMLPMKSKYCWLNSIIDRGRQRCGSFCIERFGSKQWILPKGTSSGRHFFVILISLVTVTSWFSATKTRGSRSSFFDIYGARSDHSAELKNKVIIKVATLALKCVTIVYFNKFIKASAEPKGNQLINEKATKKLYHSVKLALWILRLHVQNTISLAKIMVMKCPWKTSMSFGVWNSLASFELS